MIQGALTEARAELTALRARQSDLEQQIARAEAALGSRPSPRKEPGTTTLHQAMAQVLRESGDESMTARELADAVNERGLYRMRDGSSVEVSQVHARTHNYSAIFEKDGANIRLRKKSPMLATHPRSVTVFCDDDAGFFDWLDENPEGYFINSERNPKPTYLVLHYAPCSSINRSPSLHWTKDYVKICSHDRTDLEKWAIETVGDEVTLCRGCFG